jgi:hypothetical protein
MMYKALKGQENESLVDDEKATLDTGVKGGSNT